MSIENPIFRQSFLAYKAPNFEAIKDEHYRSALEQGMKTHSAEVEAIAGNSEKPTFENTIVAMEKSGRRLQLATAIFYHMANSCSNEALRDLQSDMAPVVSAHSDEIYLNETLFSRVKDIYQSREMLGLTAEEKRATTVLYDEFVHVGAELSNEAKKNVRALNEEEAVLTNEFGQNLLKISRDVVVVFDNEEDLAGAPQGEINIAAEAARNRGLLGKYVVELTNTTRHPMLTSIENRASREKLWRASAGRAMNGIVDNRSLVARLAQLRAEKAALLGFENWASYQLQHSMARTPVAVMEMLGSMVPEIVAKTKLEEEAIQAVMKASGADFNLQPWDWEFYAEKVRREQYELDEKQVREYFEFEHVLHDGLFYAMHRLFGITLEPRPDLPVYHPDVKAFEVFDKNGSSIALFYGDYFAREGKRGGAWMDSLVEQSRLLSDKPVVVNVMNIPKAPEGEATLLSYDEVTTLFHEFGHGVHGMFSDVTYPLLSGTRVSSDFVEFPSTFQEDWAIHPNVIANYAHHYKTGEPIAPELLEKIFKSRSFNQGFDTLEYLKAALLDMEWHSLPTGLPLQDVEEFEKGVFEKHGVALDIVPPRYKSRYFAHVFEGGYSAGYYAYMWSEILAADAYAYVQAGSGLDLASGTRFREKILALGNSVEPEKAYRKYRGQEPTTEALLVRRGLKKEEAAEEK